MTAAAPSASFAASSSGFCPSARRNRSAARNFCVRASPTSSLAQRFASATPGFGASPATDPRSPARASDAIRSVGDSPQRQSPPLHSRPSGIHGRSGGIGPRFASSSRFASVRRSSSGRRSRVSSCPNSPVPATNDSDDQRERLERLDVARPPVRVEERHSGRGAVRVRPPDARTLRAAAVVEVARDPLEVGELRQVARQFVRGAVDLERRRRLRLVGIGLARLGHVRHDVPHDPPDRQFAPRQCRDPVQHGLERLVVEDAAVDQPAELLLPLELDLVRLERDRERRGRARGVREPLRCAGVAEIRDGGVPPCAVADARSSASSAASVSASPAGEAGGYWKRKTRRWSSSRNALPVLSRSPRRRRRSGSPSRRARSAGRPTASGW